MIASDPTVLLVPGFEFPGNDKETLPRAWPPKPGDKEPKALDLVPLSAALRGVWNADGAQNGSCYITQWAPPAAYPYRLKGEAIKHLQGELSMQLLLTDIDARQKGDKAFDTLAWWNSQQPAMAEFLAAYPGAFIACSRGGLRIYQRLNEPFSMRNSLQAAEWKARYAAWCVLVDKFRWMRAKVDTSTCDWTRLQRIPHDTRGGQVQDWPTVGDAENVGTVTLPEPLPQKKREGTRTPYTGPAVEARVPSIVLKRLADVWPQPGQGCWEAALALGGVMSHSHWSEDDCVQFASALFTMAGVSDRSESQVRDSVRNSRERGCAVFGWPKLKEKLVGTENAVRFALATLEVSVPGLSDDQATGVAEMLVASEGAL